MYQEFFSLSQQPFSSAATPEFLFFTEQHKEALAHLSYGLQGNGGFVVLTGEEGTGKTSICQFLLQNMPEDTDIASITKPAASEVSLLVDICEQFSVNYDRKNISLKVMFDALTSWMLENHQQGRHAIVLIDESQHLSFKMLEQLRLLTNIESNNQKPLQIILVGQTALQETLLTTELRQLSQRITARYHLLPLSKQDTNFYIYHRLNTSGARRPIFEAKTIPIIFRASGGAPHLINKICDRCLLSAYTQSAITITPRIAKKAINETELPKKENPLKRHIPNTVLVLSLVLLATLINAQYSTIMDYFQETKKNVMQEEWAVLLNGTSQSQSDISEKKIEIKTDSSVDIPLTSTDILLAMPSTSYSLQLASLPDRQSVNAFFEENPELHKETYLYHESRPEYSKYVVLLGTFNTYSEARLASKGLKSEYPTIDPWIRDYKTIQNDIQ